MNHTEPLSGDGLEAWSNDLFEAGCEDGLPGVISENSLIAFDRETDILENAITSAPAQVRSTGAEDLVVLEL